MNIIEIKNLNKSYQKQPVLENFSLSVQENEFLAITGESGSGKSTLLNIIGMLENYDSGTVQLFGQKAPVPFSRKAQNLIRTRIGFVFQNYALLEDRSVCNNLKISVPFTRRKGIKEKISEALDAVGLKNFENRKTMTCSGGEQQRVALARLMVKPCELILADEPTGSLDPANRDSIVSLFKKLQKEGKTIIVVTHDLEFARQADRVVHIEKTCRTQF